MRDSLPGWNVPDIAGFDYLVNSYQASQDDGTISYDPNSIVSLEASFALIRVHTIYLNSYGTTPLVSALQTVKRAVLSYNNVGGRPRLGNLRQLSIDFRMLQVIELVNIIGMPTLDLTVTSAIDVIVRGTNDLCYIHIGPTVRCVTVDDCRKVEQVVAPMGYEGEVTTFQCPELLSVVGVSALIAMECKQLCDVPSLNISRSTIGPGCNSLNFFWLAPTAYLFDTRTDLGATSSSQFFLRQLAEDVATRLTNAQQYEYVQMRIDAIFTACTNLIRSRIEHDVRLPRIGNTAPSVIVNGEHSVFCSREQWEKICTNQAGIEKKAAALFAATSSESIAIDEAAAVAVDVFKFDLYVYDTEVGSDWPYDESKCIIIVPHGSSLTPRRLSRYADMEFYVLAASGISERELVELLCEPVMKGNLLYSVRRQMCDIAVVGDIPWTRELQFGLGYFEANETTLYLEQNAIITSLLLDYEHFNSVEIRECPSLRCMRVGLFNMQINISRCDSLQVIYSPVSTTVKGYISAYNCPKLAGIFGRRECMFAYNCPLLQFLPCPVAPNSKISIGPGCPLVPFPDEVVQDDHYSVETLPLLADTELSATYMQDKDLFLKEALAGNAVKAEFVRQANLFEQSRNRFDDSRHNDSHYGFPTRIVYPQPVGAFTWLATTTQVKVYHPVCFVGSRTDLTKALKSNLHPALFTTIASAKRNKQMMPRPFLPAEMWDIIAGFMIPTVKK